MRLNMYPRLKFVFASLATLVLAYGLPLWVLAALLGFLFALVSFLYLL